MAQAEALDAAHGRGEPLGALHGVPIAVKDLLYLPGFPTASGTRVMQNFDPGYMATVVARLEAAGAVIIGKTQLTEGAFGNHHPDIEPPKNPWNLDVWPGVSSSGSGVAVAAQLAFGALGTDTGGSIRFPSASCGLVGLKPTYGRVSRYGAFALAESLDHFGPMTRTVEDAARMLGVIAGSDENDPTTLSDAVPNYVAATQAAAEPAVVGVDWAYVENGVDPIVVGVIRDELAQLEALGAQVVEVTLPDSAYALIDQWGLTTGRECLDAHQGLYPERRDEYGPTLQSLLELGRSVTPELYEQIEHTRARFTSELNALFRTVDMLIAPCMTGLPATVEVMNSTAAQPDERAAFITFTAPFNYSGHPTLTLPAGLHDGLPKSYQLVGRPLEEGKLIALGHRYEQELGWHDVPPFAA